MQRLEAAQVKPLILSHHYSKRMPSNIQASFGVISSQLDAAIIFGIPAAKWREEVLELQRLVRLPDYDKPLTALVAYASDALRREGWNLLVSYADPDQDHHGGIYQAAGWHYGGFRQPCMDGILFDGEFMHGRSCHHKWRTRSPHKLRLIMPDRNIQPHYDKGKYLYWRPLNVSGKTKAKRLGLQKLAYPKPDAARSLDESFPKDVSKAQPLGAAPIILEQGMNAAN